jgi:hypothetical protein
MMVFVSRNNEGIERMVLTAKDSSVRKYLGELKSDLQCLNNFTRQIHAAEELALTSFDGGVASFHSELSFARELKSLKAYLEGQRASRMKDMERAVVERLSANFNELVKEFSKELLSIQLPLEESELLPKFQGLKGRTLDTASKLAGCLSEYDSLYRNHINELKGVITSKLEIIRDKNDREFIGKLKAHLDRALVKVKEVASTYYLLESLSNFAYRTALTELHRFPDQSVSEVAKERAVAKWVEIEVARSYRDKLSIPLLTRFIAWVLDLFR